MTISAVVPPDVHVAGIYSPAMRVSGELIFCSGIVPVDDDGKTVGVGDATVQTRQILRTLERVLAASGATLRDVARLNVFSTDMANRTQINAVRREFFAEPYPASTHVEVNRLVDPDWLLEIEAVACAPRP
jgi:enamine deaminase RidA (YjgF/YER057c/UK114 family)